MLRATCNYCEQPIYAFEHRGTEYRHIRDGLPNCGNLELTMATPQIDSPKPILNLPLARAVRLLWVVLTAAHLIVVVILLAREEFLPGMIVLLADFVCLSGWRYMDKWIASNKNPHS